MGRGMDREQQNKMQQFLVPPALITVVHLRQTFWYHKECMHHLHVFVVGNISYPGISSSELGD